MLNMESKTKLKPAELRERLEAFFGERGEGLQMERSTGNCIVFCNNIGHVTATISEKDAQTVLNLVTQEYEYQVKEFLKKLP